MLQNMFKIAWRNAVRQKQFSLLNIVGLSIGITACLLIALYVQDEMSYDKFHEKGDRIYRVNQPSIWGDWSDRFASTAPNIAIALDEDVPEFERVVRVHDNGDNFFAYKGDGQDPISFKEEAHFAADDGFFDVFTFPLVKGDANTALSQPGSIVITEETAERYFGNEEPMGKILEMDQGDEKLLFTVTGIVADLPETSHIEFDMLSSMTSYPLVKRLQWSWIWTTFTTYVLVEEGANMAAIDDKLAAIPPKWAEGSIQRIEGKSFEDYMGERTWDLSLQPITEAYLLGPSTGQRLGPSGNVLYVQIFSAVGLLILLLCAINFMNLSTARSSNRAKEVGVRKVLGSEKKQLVRQFIFESVLFASASTILAMVATEMSLGAFNSIANKELSLYAQLSNPVFAGSIISFMLLLGLLAGSYPAFYLSSFKPVEVLKGKISSGFKGKGLRNGLVVFQFAISVTLIISTFFVQKQLNYTANVNLGFDKENILQLYNMETMNATTQEAFQNVLKGKSAFLEAGISDVVPPNVYNEDKYKAYGPENPGITLNRIRANEEYVNVLDLEMLTGRNFDKTRGTDKHAVIINEAAAKILGWGNTEDFDTDSPLGKHITFPSSSQPLFEVIGVVKDFNFNSLRTDINPLIIIHEDNDLLWDNGQDYVSARINPAVINSQDALQDLIADVKEELYRISPNTPFQYSFTDALFEESFRTEQRMGQVLNIFTVMALTIACLGLFGLAAFSAEQRKKELGVRKVLGAKAASLVMLFSSEFTKLVLLALLIAVPLSYFAVDSWLSSFAYQAPIQPWVFAVAGLLALFIAWLTIGFQSMKAAMRNPIESLRDE